jgi:hypothetical protein
MGRKLKNPSSPGLPWIIHVVVGGVQYRIPDKGALTSESETIAYLRNFSEKNGYPLSEADAKSAVHQSMCHAGADCWDEPSTATTQSVSRGAVPFMQKRVATPKGGYAGMVRSGGCSSCGGGKSR